MPARSAPNTVLLRLRHPKSATIKSVMVNGKVAELGQKADPSRDRILVDGNPLKAPEKLVYIALYKPRGVLSASTRHSREAKCTSWHRPGQRGLNCPSCESSLPGARMGLRCAP